MEIVIGADHRGFALKESLKTWLQEQGHTVLDVGAATLDTNDDYPQFAIAAAEQVAAQPDGRRGIVICGSGTGVAAAAGKVHGIRAALIHDPTLAVAARNDDDINVLALGADFVTAEHARAVVEQFINTPFANEERYARRLEHIAAYERSHGG